MLQLQNRWPAFACTAFVGVYLRGQSGTVASYFIDLDFHRHLGECTGSVGFAAKRWTFIVCYYQPVWPSNDA